jgi:hypothetical protein
VTEDEYWVHLEFRVCREFEGLAERRYRYFWCDGFFPEEYAIEGAAPRIAGLAWICNGPAQQEHWRFVLVLPRAVESVDEIDWGSLLPPENMTRWMLFDEAKRSIEIDPAAAVPDLI